MVAGDQARKHGARSDSLLEGRSAERPREAKREDVSGTRILVVEDETWIAIELQRALAEGGYDVVGLAADGDTALRLATERKPTLVLMDIHLAGRADGIEAASRIYEQLGVRSVFLSGHLDAATRRRAEATHALGVVDKPVTPRELLRVLRNALDRAS